MTQDEIIEMAKQAGLLDIDYELGDWEIHELTTFAKLVAAKEREACAKLCELAVDDEFYTGKQYAENIRIERTRGEA